jgi:hypothetical protein
MLPLRLCSIEGIRIQIRQVGYDEICLVEMPVDRSIDRSSAADNRTNRIHVLVLSQNGFEELNTTERSLRAKAFADQPFWSGRNESTGTNHLSDHVSFRRKAAPIA